MSLVRFLRGVSERRQSVSGRAQGRQREPDAFGERQSLAQRSAPLPARATRAASLALLLLAAWSTGAGAYVFRGKVVGVADGDTITVLHERRPETIRLNGIDAPEKNQAFGERARQFTAQLAFGQIVQVAVRGHDRYSRTVADVLLPDGKSLNHELVRAGYAWWFRRNSNDRRLEALEIEARGARRGLWADAQPVAPWEWRQAERERAGGASRPLRRHRSQKRKRRV